jgi:alkanesulfonate monooxygenase SsuD/methylene tetrahydromethanopterin reductase-like flavin-dependent oxidoreductase (luciferase family)
VRLLSSHAIGAQVAGVNVGVYFDLRNPPTWRQDWTRLYGFTLEMCEEAEHLGAHSVWTSEHHLFEDGYLTQPLTYSAAIAARTKRVRIGTAIMIAPLRPAVQTAEEATVVDILSGGRVDLGLGAGYRVPEYELYGADIGRRYTTTDNRVRELRRLWAEGRLTPPPVQDRLPIWLGYLGPKGARRAGRLGEYLLSPDARLWAPYRDGLTEGGHQPSDARMGGGVQGFVSEDPEADWPTVSKHLAYQLDSYRRYMVEGTDQPVPKPVDPDRLRSREMGQVLGSFVFGTPEEVASRIKEHTAGAPVEIIFLFASLAGMPEDMVARHVQTICGKLAPLLTG